MFDFPKVCLIVVKLYMRGCIELPYLFKKKVRVESNCKTRFNNGDYAVLTGNQKRTFFFYSLWNINYLEAVQNYSFPSLIIC